MTDKNKAMPVVVGETVRGYYTALAQRDADWDRVKPLVAALQKVAEDDDPPDAYSEMAKRVLAPCG